MRILYIQASVVPPPVNRQIDRFFLLSDQIEGDILQPVWVDTPEKIEAIFGPGSYPVYTVGRFRYHWFLAWRYTGVRRRLAIFWFYLSKGWSLHKERRFQCIVVYAHMTTALLAGLLKLITRTKLVVEIATNPERAYLTESPTPSLKDKVMHFYSDACLHLSMLMANRAHFLFEGQLAPYPLLRRMPNSVFHEFVPVSIMDRYSGPAVEPYILLVGAPWYLKGADLLIAAFLRLQAEFPSFTLRIVGHYPDRTELDALTQGSPRIEVLKAVPHLEILRMIGQASVVVLPSRTEGMGRVLIEAMAAALPVVGSDVGGIPTMIRDGQNGFLFPSGDSHALELRLRQLLGDAELRRRMGDRGFERAHSELTESVYVESFSRMVDAAVLDKP